MIECTAIPDEATAGQGESLAQAATNTNTQAVGVYQQSIVSSDAL